MKNVVINTILNEQKINKVLKTLTFSIISVFVVKINKIHFIIILTLEKEKKHSLKAFH